MAKQYRYRESCVRGAVAVFGIILTFVTVAFVYWASAAITAVPN